MSSRSWQPFLTSIEICCGWPRPGWGGGGFMVMFFAMAEVVYFSSCYDATTCCHVGQAHRKGHKGAR